MKKILVSLLFSIFSICLFAQEKTTIKYYKNNKLKRETVERKAKYKVIKTSTEKDLIEELIEIRTNKLIWHKSFRNSKPYGEWYSFDENNSKINNVVYGKFKPKDFFSYGSDSQELIDSIKGVFSKPKLIGVDENIGEQAEAYNVSDFALWINLNVKYPSEARIKRIQGKVQTQFTIDDTGKINHVRIIDGEHEILNIESYRVLSSLPKMLPAKLNGKPIKLYIEMSIGFSL